MAFSIGNQNIREEKQKSRHFPADKKKQVSPENLTPMTSTPTSQSDPKADALAEKELQRLAHEWTCKLGEGLLMSQIRA